MLDPEVEAMYDVEPFEFEGVDSISDYPVELAIRPQRIAAEFQAREADWSKRTSRLYRAALVWAFEEMGGEDAEDARAMLYHEDVDGENREERMQKVLAARATRKRDGVLRTSSQKAKYVSARDVELLLATLNASWSKWARPLQVWFLAAFYTGLRPAEWGHAALGVDARDRRTIIVRNAKHSHGRAHGVLRTLVLNLPGHAIAIIEEHLEYVARARSSVGGFERHYTQCRLLLGRTADRIWPRRRLHPTLYSARHMFTAEAKAVMSRAEVAALMGHASIETAGIHYARKRAGGTIGVEPSDEDVSAVAELNSLRRPKRNPFANRPSTQVGPAPLTQPQPGGEGASE